MLGLCKCCIGYSNLEDKYPIKKESGIDQETSTEPLVVISEPKQLQESTFFTEDDSGACCQDEVPKSSSDEPSAENVTLLEETDFIDRVQLTVSSIGSVLDDVDYYDRVQLTVSSVNTVLEALPETEDEHDFDDNGSVRESLPLLMQKQAGSISVIPADQSKRTTVHVSRKNRLLKIESVEANGIPIAKLPLLDNQESQNGLHSKTNLMLGQLILDKNGKLGSNPRVHVSKSTNSSRHNSGDSSMKLPSVLKNKNCISVSNSAGVGPQTLGASSSSSGNPSPAASIGVISKDRERSPCVSFGVDVMYIETCKGQPRPRSRSDASARFITNSVVDWHKSKFAKLRERREQKRNNEKAASIDLGENLLLAKETPIHQDEPVKEEMDKEALPPTRERARSEKLSRPKKDTISREVAKKTPFEWPLGKLGRQKQKVEKVDESGDERHPVVRSSSVAALTKHEAARFCSKIMRTNSEKSKSKPKIGFNKSHSTSTNASWWTKLFSDKTKVNKKKSRHLTDPNSSKLCLLKSCIAETSCDV